MRGAVLYGPRASGSLSPFECCVARGVYDRRALRQSAWRGKCSAGNGPTISRRERGYTGALKPSIAPMKILATLDQS